MWCWSCGRREEECPGGVWRGGRKGAEGICVWCARAALRALDPLEQVPVLRLVRPRPGVAPVPPEAA
jgi:hypothetical protein